MTEGLPRTIGRYEIRRELGRGMMGVVYEAHDPALGRNIALKTIQLAFNVSAEQRKGFEERFLTEARVAARLSHPGIVVVHDVGQDPSSGTLFIALELLQGRTLAEVMAEGGPLEWREALLIARRVALALHHAHSAGVIHRDVKPANIMMLPSGEPKIMDFGIAKVEASHLTATGQFFGTPLYMSPEQALGRIVDARSDLFSLGALAYALITGRQAFAGESVPQIILRVIQDAPPPPSRVRPGLPAALDGLIARALAKDPSDRYPDGQTLAEDAEDILAGRAPRHARDWAGRRAAEQTRVSSAARPAGPRPRLPAAPAPRGAERPTTGPSPAGRALLGEARRARIPGWAAAAGGLAAAVALAAVLAVRQQPSPFGRASGTPAASPEPATSPSAPPPDTASPAASSPPPAAPEPAAAPAGVASPTPVPAPAAEAPAAPSRAVPERAASAPAPAKAGVPAAARASLALTFEHSLKAGRLRVFVDDALVAQQDLDSRVTKKIASLRLRKGTVSQTLEVAPGRHEVRLEAAWDDNVRTGRIWGTFDAGATRRLLARLGVGIGGFVKKGLSLEWEEEAAPEPSPEATPADSG